MIAAGMLPATAGAVQLVDVYHDPWCAVFRGGHCDCEPEVEAGDKGGQAMGRRRWTLAELAGDPPRVLVARDNAPGRRAYDLHWRRCRDRRRPFMVIRPRRTLATVHVDLESIGVQMTEKRQARIRRFIEAAGLHRRGFTSIGKDVIHVGCIPIAGAELLVDRLLALALPAISH